MSQEPLYKTHLTRVVALGLLWATGLVAAISLQGVGARVELMVVTLVVTGTIGIWMLTVQHPSRDPIFGLFTGGYWWVYLGLAVIIAVRSAFFMPPIVAVLLQVANLAVAILIDRAVEKSATKVDQENAARHAERMSMKDLQAATGQLRFDAGYWPSGDHKTTIDSSLRSLEETIRFAPSRVPPEMEQSVVDCIAVVQSTGKRLREAEGKAADWYLNEVRECERFVGGKLGLVLGRMSAGRA